MRIAVFYPDSRNAAWSVAWGLAKTLRRMGHKVVEGAIPVDMAKVNGPQLERIKESLPTVEILKGQDLILLSGAEHISPWLDALYSKYEWKKIETPKASWYHESFLREDYTIDFEQVAPWADEHFFPAVQDAEFFDQESFAKYRAHWLPFGVDMAMFNQFGKDDLIIKSYGAPAKYWDIAFIGLMYEKRENYLKALARHNFPSIRIGRVNVEDLHGWNAEESTKRLASNYRQIGVFFNLPAMSTLLVTKVYEIMACGTFLLTPQIVNERGAAKNMEPFVSGRHLVYYRPANLPHVAQLLRDFTAEDKLLEREQIARQGSAEVYANHRLEQRLETLLAKCVAKVTVQ